MQKSDGKVLTLILWDKDGILLIDYLPKGQIIDMEYYSSLLVLAIEGHFEGKSKGVLFSHNNAPAHWALATKKKLAYLGFQCLDHTPYSPDLVLSVYHLLPGLKKPLKDHYFLSNIEVIAAVETWLDGQTSEIFFF